MKKPDELQMLKVWIDSEFTLLHIMFGIIMLQITEGWLPTLFFLFYIGFSGVYWLTRLAYIAANDKDYLRLTKK